MIALFLSWCGQAGAAEPLEWRFYRAAVRAAETSLRLRETDQARAWLEEAPAQYRGFEWRHLAFQAQRSSAVHALHAGTITDLALSPDGKWLATACGDGSARLVDATRCEPRHELVGHSAAVWSPEFSPERRCASFWPSPDPAGLRHAAPASRGALVRVGASVSSPRSTPPWPPS